MTSEGNKDEAFASLLGQLLEGAPPDHALASMISDRIERYQAARPGTKLKEELSRELVLITEFFVMYPGLSELWSELSKAGQKRAMETFGSIMSQADKERRVPRAALVNDLTRPRPGSKRSVMSVVELNRTLEHLEEKKFIKRSKGENGRVYFQYADHSVDDLIARFPWRVKALREDYRHAFDVLKWVSYRCSAAEGLAKEYASRLGVPPDIVERQIVELAEGEAARDGKK